MKVLLDTCAFLWITTDAKELSENARQIFRNPKNEMFLSSVSVWEIMVKNGIGKLPLPSPAQEFITSQRIKHEIETLPLTEKAIFHLKTLPKHHQDPFDRMLICQAIEYDLTILTCDGFMEQYPVKTAW
ncbi:MAG: type II toxin-antitoxin system VapC family toxin [Methylococcaceae bacterium]